MRVVVNMFATWRMNLVGLTYILFATQDALSHYTLIFKPDIFAFTFFSIGNSMICSHI